MSRQLLVIHDSRTVRNIIKRQVLAEAPDLVVHDAGCHDEAKDMIKNQPFDIAICDDALSGIDGLSLCLDAKKQSLNPDIAFILLLAPTAAAHRVPLLERNGFANYLVSPFTQEQLVAQIAAVCDPRKKRMHRRISIPKCKALLKFDAKEYPAELINLSLSGFLCEFRYDDDCGDMFRLASITLCFPAEYGSAKIDNLWGAALRITVESHRSDHSPSRIRVAFMFVNPLDVSIATLNDILAKAEKDNSLQAIA
jgi:CheY-like chemotaxis protein